MHEEWFVPKEEVRDLLKENYALITKAKELLAKWVELFKPKGGNIPPTPIQVDTEQFLSEEVPYNEGEEWHFVKDGLPSENAMLLVARKTVNGVQALIGYYKSNQFEIFNEKSCKMQNIDSVYAWKEIVLPEPKETK